MARRGDPDADHALAFVETVADPEGLYAPQPTEAPIGRVVEIAYNGIKRQVRVDANGRVVAENPVADDGWSTRGTFTGDAAGQEAGRSVRSNRNLSSHRAIRYARPPGSRPGDRASTPQVWTTRRTADRSNCPPAQVLHRYRRLYQSSRHSP